MAVVVPFSMGMARGGCALRDVDRQRVAGSALQGSYGEASAINVLESVAQLAPTLQYTL